MINDGRLAEADALLTKVMFDPYNRSVLPYTYFWKGELGYRNNQLDTAIKYYHAYIDAGAPAAGKLIDNVAITGYADLRKENYPVSLTFFEPLSKSAASILMHSPGCLHQDADNHS